MVNLFFVRKHEEHKIDLPTSWNGLLTTKFIIIFLLCPIFTNLFILHIIILNIIFTQKGQAIM